MWSTYVDYWRFCISQRLFSFMDRGVVFKIVARYLEAFSVKENLVRGGGKGGEGVCVCVCVSE